MNRLRSGIGVLGGVAAIALVLALPAPRHPAAAVTARAGPPTLATVWPAAKPFPIPAGYPDGSTYSPRVVVDPTTSIGELTRPGGVRTDLVVAPASGPPRVLQSHTVADGASYDGITVTADHIYWMHTLSDTTTGRAHVTLWAAARAGGPATQLTADTGAPVFYNSEYDVRIADGRIYWAATRPGHPDETELRSLPLTGGHVTVRVLTGAWALSSWPWLVTAPTASISSPTQLRNLTTGAVVTVAVPAGKLANCSPTWCRLIPDNAGDATATTLIRPDGSDPHTVTDAKAVAVNSDAALADRFELLTTLTSSSAQTSVSTLALYDLHTRRSTLITPAATNAAGEGPYVWWSTGDNETLTWHGLDLRTLP